MTECFEPASTKMTVWHCIVVGGMIARWSLKRDESFFVQEKGTMKVLAAYDLRIRKEGVSAWLDSRE